MSDVRRAAWTAWISWVGSTAEATPPWVDVAVHVLVRLGGMIWVPAKTAMRWPSIVVRYGANAWAALAPAPARGKLALAATASPCVRPA